MKSCLLQVRVTPRAGRTEVIGWQGDVLRVRVAAPPVQGKANAALLRILADVLDVSVGALRIVRGESSRSKTVQIEGVSEEEVRQALGAPQERLGGL